MAFAQNPVTLNNTGNILYLGNNITKLGSNLTIGTSPVANQQFYFLGNGNVTGNLIIGGNLDFYGNLLSNGVPYVGSQWTTQVGNIYYMGNVGINRVSPIYPLDVVGDANISSNLYVSNVYIRENCVIQSGDFSILNGNLSVYKNFNAFGESFLSGNLTIYNSDIYNYGNIYTYNGLYINKNGALYTQNETSGQHALYTYDTVNSMTTLFGGADDTNRVGYMGVGGYGTSLPLILNPLGGNVGINNGNPRQRLDVAGSANISVNAFVRNNLVVGSTSATANLTVSGNARISSNLYIGETPFNIQNGTLLGVRNTSVIDSNISGSLSGNVYHQLAMGGRNWVFSQDVSNDGILYFGQQGGGDPDPDFDYFYKRGVGLQIQPSPSIITTDFTEALKVLGRSNIVGNLTAFSNVIVPNGNLGLRTTTTNATLDVNGNILISGNVNFDNGLFWTDPINNRVGILNTNPQYDLDVKGTANVSGNIYANGFNIGLGIPGYYYPNVKTMSLFHNTNNGLIGFNYPNPECMLLMTNLGGGLLSWGMYMGVVKDLASTSPTNSLRLDLGSSRDLATNVNNTGANTIVPRVSIRYHGNAGIMGINRTNPMYALDVNGTANISADVIMNANANVIGNLEITGNLIGTSNIILLNGNMGVGTSDPQYRLDVSGSTRITTTLDVNSKALEVFSGIINLNTSSINLLGNPNVTDGFIRLVKSGSIIYLQPALQQVAASTAPLVISRYSDAKRIMTITEDAVAIGNITGTSPQANLYVLGNAMITGNMNVDNGTLWVDATNNRVGILNTNPQYAFDVKGDSNITGRLYVGGATPIESTSAIIRNTTVDSATNGTTSGTSINILGLNNGVRIWYYGSDGANNSQFYFGTSGGDATNPDYFCYWDTGGKMMLYPAGTATITPPNSTDLFTVRGNANIVGNILFTGSVFQNGVPVSLGSQWTTSGANIYYNVSNGNVGIGTITPVYPLDISGNTRMNGNLIMNSGNIFLSTGSNVIVNNGANILFSNVTVPANQNFVITGGANAITATYIHRDGGVSIKKSTVSSSYALDINGNQLMSGVLVTTDTSDTTSLGTGSMRTSGGISISKNANVGANIFGGNLLIQTNVGINTLTPGANLDVVGNARISGNVNIDNGLFWTDTVNNRVGINNTNPQYTLDVNGDANVNGNIYFNTDGDGIDFFGSGNKLYKKAGTGITCETTIFTIADITGTTTVLHVEPSTGEIGIGTTNPQANLHVNGNAIITGNLNVDNGLLWTDPVNNRVGINNTNPQQALDVNGSANITGTNFLSSLAFFSSVSNMTSAFKMVYGTFATGTVASNATFTTTVTFSNSFSSTPWIVLTVPNNGAFTSASSTYTTTTFIGIAKNYANSNQATTVTYLAIGPA